jgi:hypothetical protein
MRPNSTSPTILFSTVRNPPLVTSQQVRTISTQNDGRETCACHVSPELAGDLPTHLSLSGRCVAEPSVSRMSFTSANGVNQHGSQHS